MRYREFLLEYNRAITKKNFGEKLVVALKKEFPRDDKWKMMDNPATKQVMIDSFIESFENADPTPNKEYVQWIIRRFVDPKNLVKYEDYMGQLPAYLKKFHKLKQRRMIDNPRNDINRYDNVPDFMNVVDEYPDPESGQELSNKGSATTYYEDKDLRVIEPRDQQAACYYGQGTRWCTSATVGKNMFTRYNDKGPLYIIIPKQPKYNGEKYQFHFATNSFMNEKDQSIKGNEKELVERYPQLGQIFSQQIQQTDRGYWMTGGLTPQDRERLVKILKNNTVTMSDGTHVVSLNDANRIENLDITKEHKAAMLLTNGQYGTDDPTDSDLSRNGDGLPILAFALFNKDFTDGVLLFADVNDGEVEYSVPKTGSYNKDMPEDIKPVYNELLKITKSPYLDNIQTFDKIQETFVPPKLRMSMFDIKDYLGMDDDY